MAYEEYTWIFGIVTVAFAASSFSNGANDIANSYSTTVAARSLKLIHVGIIAGLTEFVGAVFFGSRVTNTLKSNIIDISRFDDDPAVLMVLMMCAEVGSAVWLWFATTKGFTVSTTQTTMGAIIGAGIGAGAMPDFSWGRNSRITQTILTWTVAPLCSAVVAACVYGLVSFAIIDKKRSLDFGTKLMPLVLAATATVMALFILMEQHEKNKTTDFGVKLALPIVLSSFFGMLALGYVFWLPFVRRRLIHGDSRIRIFHLSLGPYLASRNPKLWRAGSPVGEVVPDYNAGLAFDEKDLEIDKITSVTALCNCRAADPESVLAPASSPTDSGFCSLRHTSTAAVLLQSSTPSLSLEPATDPTPEERWLDPYKDLRVWNPLRFRNLLWYYLLQGVSRDVITVKTQNEATTANNSEDLEKEVKAPKARPSAEALARRENENRKEHLLTYGQVMAAMMMSVAHGSNDVSNAVGPWVTVYAIWNKYTPSAAGSHPEAYKATNLVSKSPTPVWILVAAALLMALGFWIRGWKIMSATGTKLVRQTPSRGFSVAMGTALIVLLASRIGMPVSTTQCVIGSCVGVGFFGGGGFKIRRRTAGGSASDIHTRNPIRMIHCQWKRHFEVVVNKETVNWSQVVKMFTGWLLTLPIAGAISGILAAAILRSPSLYSYHSR
jgi:sodium-dependent phosphate transporter